MVVVIARSEATKQSISDQKLPKTRTQTDSFWVPQNLLRDFDPKIAYVCALGFLSAFVLLSLQNLQKQRDWTKVQVPKTILIIFAISMCV